MNEIVMLAKRMISSFLNTYPRCFPPLVLNLTDGQPTDANPLSAAEELKNLRSSDGNVLMFNAHLSSTPSVPLTFPSDETGFPREGTLDFIDNALDRSSGTIHARATVPNPDLFLAPGQFARLRVAIAPPAPVYLLPDAAVMLDQSQRLVMTVGPDSTVKPKVVTTGDLRGGLRVIRSGLEPSDRRSAYEAESPAGAALGSERSGRRTPLRYRLAGHGEHG